MNPRRLGVAAALCALAIDQTFKAAMLGPFDLAARAPVRLLPYLDLTLAWNKGISYSLLTTQSAAGRAGLIAVMAAATLLILMWMWRASRLPTAAGLGLIAGGALGNLADRLVHGAVADFFHFHVGGFSWYVFNPADIAISLGVALLAFEALAPAPTGREPRVGDAGATKMP